jgi:hypothetical protein
VRYVLRTHKGDCNHINSVRANSSQSAVFLTTFVTTCCCFRHKSTLQRGFLKRTIHVRMLQLVYQIPLSHLSTQSPPSYFLADSSRGFCSADTLAAPHPCSGGATRVRTARTDIPIVAPWPYLELYP